MAQTAQIKLSEIIRTDCYIDCGSNEKLREVYPLIDMPESIMQQMDGYADDCIIQIKSSTDKKYTVAYIPNGIIHHISQIDLNG
jgi:hypothetical protein